MRFKLGSTHNSLVINFVLLDLLALCYCDRFPDKNIELVELASSRHAHRANTSAHLIFNTVSGLLQHWPNTIYRNGHTFVPASILSGTILYHGRTDYQLPSSPEFFAFDVDHSYLFSIGYPCLMLTFSAKRDLRIGYFDGTSAADLRGPRDFQDILTNEKFAPPEEYNPWVHAKLLCEWGGELGLDGIARMEQTFEVILCNTRSALELIEQVELAHPEFPITDLIPTLLGSNDSQAPNEGSTPKATYPRFKYDFPILQWPTIPFFPPPIGWVGRHRDPPSTMFEAMRAGRWHNHWPGEARIQLDYSGVVSAYDEVYTSLVESQRGVPRSRHRLREMSTRDKEHLKSEVRSVLLRKQSRATVNWSALFQGFINRYGDRLEDLRRILRHSGRSPPETAALAREKVLIMLTPHMVLPRAQPHSSPGSSVPPSQAPSNQAHLTQSRPDDDWIKRIYRSCSGSPVVAVLRSDKLTKQERVLAKSIDTIQNEICYTLTNIWSTAFDFPDSPFLPQIGLYG